MAFNSNTGKSRTRQILQAVTDYTDTTGHGPSWAWLTDKKGFPPFLLNALIAQGYLKLVPGERYEKSDCYLVPARPITAEELLNLQTTGRTTLAGPMFTGAPAAYAHLITKEVADVDGPADPAPAPEPV